MRVTVLGAGVVGLATAYYLVRDGHEVSVVDRNDGVALETSFANGAQLSYSYVAPLAGPGILPRIPPWLLRRDSPLRFYPKFDVDQWRWLVKFVLACNARQSDLTTRRVLALSFYSRKLMAEFLAIEDIEFGHARNGKLVVHCDPKGFDAARRLVDFQRSLGCDQDALSRDQCFELEPALANSGSRLSRKLVGAIHTSSEEVGDCYRFCLGLEHRLMALGVKFVLGTTVWRLALSGGQVTHVETSAGDLESDVFVLALGAQTPWLARRLGIRLSVYPLKGYSLTLAGCRRSRVAEDQRHRLQAQGRLRAARARGRRRCAARCGDGGHRRLLDASRPGSRQATDRRSESGVSRRHGLFRPARGAAALGGTAAGDTQGIAAHRGDAGAQRLPELRAGRAWMDPCAWQRAAGGRRDRGTKIGDSDGRARGSRLNPR